jgi:molybdopterin-guanine dinucleotide biosynthesis protein A
MGAEKAFVLLDGRPLIAHAIERLRPQVGSLAISANGDPQRFASFGFPVLADAEVDRDAGPLAGIVASLAFGAAEGRAFVVTAPCDAPYAPRDLVQRLGAAVTAEGAMVALAESQAGLEPLFGLWRVELLPALRNYLSRGGRSPRDLMNAQGAARARFAGGDGEEPFVNLNNPTELRIARAKHGEP